MIKGSHHTLEAKRKNRNAHLGKRTGTKNNKWRGNKVGYGALHDWIRRNYGKPNKCENSECSYRNPKRYEWANISGKYKRDISDWKPLCSSCHRKFDWKPKNNCRKGHILKIVGIWIDNRGSRICKECKRLNARKDYERHKDYIIKKVNERRERLRSTIKR